MLTVTVTTRNGEAGWTGARHKIPPSITSAAAAAATASASPTQVSLSRLICSRHQNMKPAQLPCITF